jgi:hypothetical protein
MIDYGSLLRDHVTLRCRRIDRIFLQAYAPKLQTVGEVCTFYAGKGIIRFLRRLFLARLASSMLTTLFGSAES